MNKITFPGAISFSAHFICDECRVLCSPGFRWGNTVTNTMFDPFENIQCPNCDKGKLRWARQEEFEEYSEDKDDI